MNILIIAHFIPHPPHGGAIQRNINLLKGLAKNHNIHYITFNQKVHLPSSAEVERGVNEVSKYCKTIQVFEIPSDKSRYHWYWLLFRNLFSLLPYSVSRYYSAQCKAAVCQAIAKSNFDVVLIDTIALAQYAQWVDKTPCILCHHNIESNLLFRKAATTKNVFAKAYIWLQAYKLRRYEHHYSQSLAANTVVSEVDQTQLQKLHPHAVSFVVPNGTDIEYFNFPSAEAPIPYRMIFAGGMAWYPNADAMLHFCRNLFPEIKKQLPQASIDIIGAAAPQELYKLATTNPDIHIHGFVQDVRKYIAKAVLYVVPIRVGGGTRLKILDAMAQQIAIVSTDIGAEGLAVQDNVDILLAKSDEEFVDKVVAALHDVTLRTQIAGNARKTVEQHYCWPMIIPKLEQALTFAAQKD